MATGTEFAHDFCAMIGPLQLGVVLVSHIVLYHVLPIVLMPRSSERSEYEI